MAKPMIQTLQVSFLYYYEYKRGFCFGCESKFNDFPYFLDNITIVQVVTQVDPEETQYDSSQSVTASGQETAAEPVISQQILSLAEVRTSELIAIDPSQNVILNLENPLEIRIPTDCKSGQNSHSILMSNLCQSM